MTHLHILEPLSSVKHWCSCSLPHIKPPAVIQKQAPWLLCNTLLLFHPGWSRSITERSSQHLDLTFSGCSHGTGRPRSLSSWSQTVASKSIFTSETSIEGSATFAPREEGNAHSAKGQSWTEAINTTNWETLILFLQNISINPYF